MELFKKIAFFFVIFSVFSKKYLKKIIFPIKTFKKPYFLGFRMPSRAGRSLI